MAVAVAATAAAANLAFIHSTQCGGFLLLADAAAFANRAFFPSSPLAKQRRRNRPPGFADASICPNAAAGQRRRRRVPSGPWSRVLRMNLIDGEDEEDELDDEEEIDLDALGDWRTFRMNLTNDGTRKERKERKSVAKANERLLMDQNEELAREYREGVWAHEVSTPEVGGLVCRLPLEAEIYRDGGRTTIGKKLRSSLGIDDGSGDDGNEPRRSGPSSSYDDSASEDDGKDDLPKSVSFSPLGAKTVFWYRGAETLVKKELEDITSSADATGGIDASRLPSSSIEFLQMYLDNQETWQEVCLVLDRNESTGSATTVVLNRPMAMKLTENLAMLALLGAYSPSPDEAAKETLGKFLLAFSSECAIYVGGPDKQEEPAILVHGIKDLPGATEISPGTGVYQGGIEAAIAGVLERKYKPLDFRFFVGRHEYKNRELEVRVRVGKYQPIACARSVALKQCIALPKPLWHEVLELCGGELKEMSKLELMKRDDIQIEEADEN